MNGPETPVREHVLSLTIAERLMLVQGRLIPTEGDFIVLKRAQELKDRLTLTELEMTAYGVVNNGQTITWNPEFAATTTEIEIGQSMWDRICGKLKEFNSSSTLRADEVGFYEKFIDTTPAPLGISD